MQDEDEERLLRKRYRRLELIGRGGMASVYRGRDEALGRDVAIKKYPPARNDADARRQEAEVAVVASLSHHSLVTLLDAGTVRNDAGEPQVYLVMELVGGVNLQELIARGAMSARDISYIGHDIAEGLQYIHHNGVVHRDIKPSNILMVDYRDNSHRPRAKLTDFGIAQTVGTPSRDEKGATSGTAAYLSPEQVLRNAIGAATDIYSLGLVLLECFTRELAFPGERIESAMARLDRSPAIPEHLDSEWKRVLSAMTARDAADRPDAAEVATAMRDLVIAETGRHKAAVIVEAREASRMEAVRLYDILDTPPDSAFDRITRLAARVLRIPIAIVSIVDTDRIWFKSHYGVDVDQIERERGLCSSAIMHSTPLIIGDARLDPKALADPLVAGDFGLQFYAGVPLQTSDGHNIGTLCILDFEPRTLTEDEIATLEDLAAMVMNQLELRLDVRRAIEPSTIHIAV